MNAVNRPEPKPGDVLFTSQPDGETLLSWGVQSLVDRDARRAPRAIGHVAIVCTENVALESVPSEDAQPAVGAWSGEVLSFGTRPILVGDLLVGARRSGARWWVLRRSEPLPPHTVNALSLASPEVMRLIGSGYSIESLKGLAEEKLRLKIPAALRNLFDWSAESTDLLARTELTDAHLEQIAQHVPGAVEYFQSHSFFCSQLVRHLLEHARLCEKGELDPQVTPSGLFVRLSKLGWRDMTGDAYSSEAVAGLEADSGALAHARACFAGARALHELALQQFVSKVTVDYIAARMNEVSRFCEDLTSRLTERYAPTAPATEEPTDKKSVGAPD